MILLLREDTALDTDQEVYIENTRDIRRAGYIKNGGCPFPGEMPVPQVVVERPTEQVDYMDRGLFLISQEAKELFTAFGVPFEFVKCDVITTTGIAADSKYYHCNVLEVVECMDLGKSKVYRDRYITGIELLALDDQVARGHHLFLVGPVLTKGIKNPDAISDVIYGVSEELASEMLRQEFSNVAFCRPQHWQHFPVSQVAWSPDQ